MNPLSENVPLDYDRPREFVCMKSQEFFDVCHRAEAGEFYIEGVRRPSKKERALWIVSVVYTETKQAGLV